MKRTQTIKSIALTGLASSLVFGAAAREVKFAAPERLEVPGFGALEGPELVDYDGDGTRDMLSGNYAGNLIFRKNTGSDAKPKWAEPVRLQRDGENIKLRHW